MSKRDPNPNEMSHTSRTNETLLPNKTNKWSTSAPLCRHQTNLDSGCPKIEHVHIVAFGCFGQSNPTMATEKRKTPTHRTCILYRSLTPHGSFSHAPQDASHTAPKNGSHVWAEDGRHASGRPTRCLASLSRAVMPCKQPGKRLST